MRAPDQSLIHALVMDIMGNEVQVKELMKRYFPNCPICKAETNYLVSGVWRTYVQCEVCGAKWWSINFEICKELKNLTLKEPAKGGRGYLLLDGKEHPPEFWRNLSDSDITSAGCTMQCSRCGKKLGGLVKDGGIYLKLETGEVTVCAECFLNIKKEYEARDTCNDCAFFKDGYCKKIRTDLTPVWIGADAYTSNDYYLQREKCVHFITRQEYEARAIKGEIGTTGTSQFVVCKYCHTRYDWNQNVKCPICGSPNTLSKKAS